MKRNVIIIITVLAALVLGIILFIYSNNSQPTDVNIISKTGIHWHANLTVYIKGEKRTIAKDIGIGSVHKPFHTHDDTGELHLEFDGLVTKDDTRLKQFFQNWNKAFKGNCIFEFCNSNQGQVKFLVNGKENTEFENYEVKDGDKLEIRYD